MKKIPVGVKVGILSVFFTLLVIFGMYKFWGGGRFVPKEFIEARSQGALVADRVAWLSSVSLQNLQKVSFDILSGSVEDRLSGTIFPAKAIFWNSSKKRTRFASEFMILKIRNRSKISECWKSKIRN